MPFMIIFLPMLFWKFILQHGGQLEKKQKQTKTQNSKI